MKLSESVMSIGHLKAHASELLREVNEEHKTFVITQNGQPKAVLQDIHDYEAMQESLAMLRLLAQSEASVRAGRVTPLREAFQEVRKQARPNRAR